MTATVYFVNRQSDYQYFLFLNYYYFLVDLISLDYVNYHVVIFTAHLHLNELSLICNMWLNKITYLLMEDKIVSLNTARLYSPGWRHNSTCLSGQPEFVVCITMAISVLSLMLSLIKLS